MPAVARLAIVAPDHTLTVRRFTGYAIHLEAAARRLEREIALGRRRNAWDRNGRPALRRADKLRAQAKSWRDAARIVSTLHKTPPVEIPREDWTAPVAAVLRG